MMMQSDQAALLTAAKKALRREMQQRRKAIPPQEKAALDSAMQEQFFASELYRKAELLLTFLSVGEEPDTRAILRRAWADGKVTAVPKCLSGHRMQFYVIKDFSDCVPGMYDIPEPKDTCPEVRLTGGNVVCLVPGLAFDRKGARLGYGGGYYDRFLQKHPFICAVGYGAERFVVDAVPEEDTDQRLWGLITENMVEVRNGEQKTESGGGTA
ncbi:MAG: 5-formyltetrahydrofolate cyclo-ligase [Ruminococcus sp.]|nr:5-formyltetrahydrofolate cyclo-ligase [Ruminococcus sp.]